MNPEQKRFFNAVILPKLVEMAIDGTLPSDMNELDYSYFEKEAEKFNAEKE